MEKKIYIVVYENEECGSEETITLRAFEDCEKAKIYAEEKRMEELEELYIDSYGKNNWDKATDEEKENYYDECEFWFYVSTLTLEQKG